MHSIYQQIGKLSSGHRTWKGQFFIPLPKKGNEKEYSNYHTIALISHASKVMFKILQARLQQYMNRELPDVQAGFWRGRGTRDQIANICLIMEKAREFQKNIYFCFIDYVTVFVRITINYGKVLKRWVKQSTLPVSWETYMWVKKQQLEPCMEQLIRSRLRKEYNRALSCYPAYLTYVLSTLWEMPDRMSCKLESR